MIKKILLWIVAIVLTVVVAYAAMYAYLLTKAAFTWQCQIYVGEMSAEGRKVCADYNSGGMLKVLTN
jgi:capsular polysaccharide biosynthesis protein